MAFKKKLYTLRPGHGAENAEQFVQSRYTRARGPDESAPDPASIEQGVRQLLADKVSGDLVGLWLLVAEHLRLRTWDLLEVLGQVKPAESVEPRLAMPKWSTRRHCARLAFAATGR